jgi:uncharacterized membrane protein YjdF
MRRLFNVIDGCDMIGAILAAPVLIILLVTGHFPHDLELWFYGVAGIILIVAIALAIRARRKPKE